MFVRKKRGTASRKTKRGDPRAVGSAEVAGGPPTPRTPSHTCRAWKTPGDPLRLPSVWPHRRPLACPVSSCPPSPNWRRRPGAHKSRHPSCRPGSPGRRTATRRGRGGQASEQPPRRSGSGPRLPCGARVRLGRFGACQARAGLPPGRSVGPVARETPNRSTSSVRRDLCRFRAFSYLSLR
jgi:hypothetical protein